MTGLYEVTIKHKRTGEYLNLKDVGLASIEFKEPAPASPDREHGPDADPTVEIFIQLSGGCVVSGDLLKNLFGT